MRNFVPKETFEKWFWYKCPNCPCGLRSPVELDDLECSSCGETMDSVEDLENRTVELNPVFSMPSEPPKGSKFDQGKPRWGLLPWAELETVVEVLTKGAEKYSDDNWKQVEHFESRYRDALMRHFSAYCKGETEDPESGKSHLAHVVCCALFLMWKENQ